MERQPSEPSQPAPQGAPPLRPSEAPSVPAPAADVESCDWCGSTDLWWRSCKLLCRSCNAIVKSCADL